MQCKGDFQASNLDPLNVCIARAPTSNTGVFSRAGLAPLWLLLLLLNGVAPALRPTALPNTCHWQAACCSGGTPCLALLMLLWQLVLLLSGASIALRSSAATPCRRQGQNF